MNTLKNNKHQIQNLTKLELIQISAGSWGFWPTFWTAYLIKEVVDGVQNGISADCSEALCNIES